MFGGPSVPAMPAAPEAPPNVVNPDVQAGGAAAARLSAAQAAGRASTILTGGSGVQTQAPTVRRTLLGGGI